MRHSASTPVRRRLPLLLLAGAAAMTYGAGRPVCVPLSAETVSQFDPPISERTDRDTYLRVFQLRDGQWHHCKTWISRQFFF